MHELAEVDQGLIATTHVVAAAWNGKYMYALSVNGRVALRLVVSCQASVRVHGHAHGWAHHLHYCLVLSF